MNMVIFIFDCPCCDERHVLSLAVSFENKGNVNQEDWDTFLRVSRQAHAKVIESPKFKQWQEVTA